MRPPHTHFTYRGQLRGLSKVTHMAEPGLETLAQWLENRIEIKRTSGKRVLCFLVSLFNMLLVIKTRACLLLPSLQHSLWQPETQRYFKRPSTPLGGKATATFLTRKVQIFYVASLYPFDQFWNPDIVFFHDRDLGFQLLVLCSGHIPLEATEAFFMHPSSDEPVFNDEVS